MAMLAEPRRKQRWTLNPRGKHWSEDSTKFGQKMLEKMGWSSGKGLGANEQGMTEHVRVAFKNDSAGIGFKNDGMDKAWTEHQDGFNDLLKELQGGQETAEIPIVETKHETLSGKSLEMKSKQSRARVHYHKFTRGKDVNKYSSKDLANIFGHKDLSTINAPKEEKVEEEEEYCPDPVGTQDTLGGVLTIKSGSITDYLKNKRPNLYKAAENSEADKRTDSEDEPMYAGFGFSSNENKEQSSDKGTVGICKYGGFVNPCLDLDSPEPTASPTVKSKKLKKRKSGSTFYDEEMNDSVKVKEDAPLPTECMNGFANPALSLGNEAEETPNGSEFEVSRAEFGLTNSAFDLEGEKERKRRVTFNDQVEYSTDPIKKKKGKATLDKFEVEIKKPKRKRKHEESETEPTPIGFVNEALDCEDKSEEILDNEINERKTRKAKKRRPSILETIVEIPEEDKSETAKSNVTADPDIIEIQENDTTEVGGKKKSKKKKKDKVKDQEIQEGDVTIKEVQIVEQVSKKKKDQPVQEQVSENGTDESKKKKKRKHTEKAGTNEPEVIPEQSNTKDEESSTRKKKEKKSKRDAEKHEVISIEPNSENEKEVSGKENERTEEDGAIKRKKKKSKHEKTKSTEKMTEVDLTGNVDERKEKAENNLQGKIISESTNNMDCKIPRSPWNERARMSKKLLQSFFHRNAISNFPGSNIYDIEGYGAQMS